MIFWLLYNLGYRRSRKPLTYAQIALHAHMKRSTVQTAVKRFEQKLPREFDSKLAGHFLRVAAELGLGYNMTYNKLSELGYVPPRKREIDGFDDLNHLT